MSCDPLRCTRRAAQVRDEQVNDTNDLARRNIMDGDPFMATTPSWRFKSSEVEPYMPSQVPGEAHRPPRVPAAAGRLAPLA